MNKKLTFLLSLTFLFLISGSSVVFSYDAEDVEKLLENTIKKNPSLKKGWLEMEEVSPAEDAYMNGDSKKAFKILKPLRLPSLMRLLYQFISP